MKKLIFITALFTSCFLFKDAAAQIHISLGANIVAQPEWGPVGYSHAEYYYMPDVDAYYDVPNHQYVYRENNVWVHRPYLQAQYRNYDVYHGYKVVVNERNPWRHHEDIRARYAQYRGRHDQQIIRDSHDDQYRNHWRDGDHRDGDRRDGDHRDH
jgi:hypothetical protein